MSVTRRVRRPTQETASMTTTHAFGVDNPTRDYILELAATTSQTFCDTLVTPELAAIILTLNTENRPIRRRQLANFDEILNEGRFVNTGEPIIISRPGVLNEGQHRLTSVVTTGKPAIMDIRVGVAREAFAVTGTGAGRSPGDVVALADIANPHASASAAKMAHFYFKGLPDSFRWRLGSDLVLAALKRWPDIEEAVRLTTNLTHSRYFKNSATGCFIWLGLRAGRGEEVATFIQEVLAGGRGPASSPTKMLYNLLTGDLRLRMGRGEEAVEKLALHIIAWNSWTTKEPLPRIRWARPQPFPIFPGAKF